MKGVGEIGGAEGGVQTERGHNKAGGRGWRDGGETEGAGMIETAEEEKTGRGGVGEQGGGEDDEITEETEGAGGGGGRRDRGTGGVEEGGGEKGEEVGEVQ